MTVRGIAINNVFNAHKGAPPCILAINSSRNNENIVEILINAGYEVARITETTAISSAAQRVRPDSVPPDLVLIDSLTSGEDSVELISACRADDFLRDASVILISSENNQSNVETLLPMADDFLATPFSAAELLKRIDVQLKLKALKNEERLRSATEVAELGPWERNLVTGRLIASDRLKAMYGMSPKSEFSSDAEWQNYLHPDDRPVVSEKLRSAIAGECDYEVEYRIRRVDGEERWLHSRGRVLRNSAGRPLRMLGVAIEISKRKQIEEALRQSEERYRAFVEQSSEAIWRCEMENPVSVTLGAAEQIDQIYCDAYLAECNDAMAHTYGYERASQILGRRLRELLPKEEKANIEYLRAFIASGYRLTEAESQRQDKNGGTRIFRNNLIGVVERGNLIRVWGTQRDITERREARTALRESEARLRMALTGARAGVWEWNLVTRQVVWSPELFYMLGIEQESVKPSFERFLKIVHPEDAVQMEKAFRQAVERGGSFDFEFRVITNDGRLIWLSSIGRVELDSNGRPIKAVGINQDITDRKMAEEQIAQLLRQERAAREAAEYATRAKDEILAIVSHELRSPLNAILGWARMLGAQRHNDPEIRKIVDTIDRNGRAQNQLIEDLIDTARIISGKLRLDVKPIELSGVVASAIDTIRTAAEAKKINLEFVADDHFDSFIIIGDVDRLQQIAWNLLANAIKFTSEGGSVRTWLSRENSFIRLSISDTGQGIRPELLPYIFDRFRQGDSSTSRRYGGLGLGLALVKHLVEMHGGDIMVESEGEGLGSVFTLLFPMHGNPKDTVLTETEVTPQQAFLPENSHNLRGLRILLVDDEDAAREFVEYKLREHGAEISSANSALTALEILENRDEEEQIEVLVSDIGMADIDGYELMQRIRAHEKRWISEIPAIAVTAYTRFEDRMKVLEAGYQMHVPKPVEEEELITVIASVTGRIRH